VRIIMRHSTIAVRGMERAMACTGRMADEGAAGRRPTGRTTLAPSQKMPKPCGLDVERPMGRLRAYDFSDM